MREAETDPPPKKGRNEVNVSLKGKKALLALAAATMALSNVPSIVFAQEESFEESSPSKDEVSTPVAVGESTIKDIKASLKTQKDRLEKETNAAMKEQIQDYIDQLENQLERYEMVPMYRLYNPNSGEHLYTKDGNERKTLIGIGWKDEAVGWYAPVNIGDPVYRLYNGKGREGEHHYTRSKEERDDLIAAGWSDEGVGWNSMYNTEEDVNAQPVYREYNPNEYANNHNYTVSKNENDTLVKLGWNAEGIAWYGLIRYLKEPAADGGFTYFDQEEDKYLSGWNTFDAATFYFDPSNGNKAATGSYQIDGKYYLFNDEGHLQRGQVDYNGERYFLDAGTGQALIGYTLLEPGQTDGEYRFVYLDSTGKAVRNQSVNGMNFDSNGFKTNLTPDETIQIEALEVLDSTGHDLGKAFDWTAKNIAYKHYEPEYFPANAGMTQEQTFALVGLQQRVGNVYVYSQVYAELAKALGYQAKMVVGTIKTTSGETPHAWVEIVVDGQKYICDPEMYAKADGFPRNYCYMQPIDKTTFVYNY